MSKHLGRSIAATTDQIISTITQAEHMLTTVGVDSTAPSHQAVRQARAGLTEAPPAISAGMRHVVEAVQSHQVWRSSSRTVLTPHPDFSADLCYARTGPVQWKVLEQLAHPDPLVVYPHPVQVENYDYRLLGFQAYGTSQSRRQVHSTAESQEGDFLSLLLFLEQQAEVHMAVIDLPRAGADSIHQVLDRVDGVVDGDVRMYHTMAGYTVHALLYLCCSERDESHQGAVRGESFFPASSDRRARSGRRGFPIVGLGYHLASDMDLTSTQGSSTTGTGSSGRKLAGHRRRSHLRFQRHGPGLSQMRLVRVRSYWTHGPESQTVPIRRVVGGQH